jgi:hypothetical protein
MDLVSGGIRLVRIFVFLGKEFLSGVYFYRRKEWQIGNKQHKGEKLDGCLKYFKR